MNIFPFIPSHVSLFDIPISWVFIILLAIGIAFIIVPIVRSLSSKHSGGTDLIAIGAFLCIMPGIILMSGAPQLAEYQKQYDAQLDEANKSIQDAGFSIVSGDLDIHKDTQSLMMLKYDGTNYDCTAFSPANPETEIVFSCGPMKQTLSDIVAENK